jgi:hypothetical protein
LFLDPLVCQCLWICPCPLPCHLLISLDFLVFSPIRSLIESGIGASKRSDVRLYYGARNLKRMAYQVCLNVITITDIFCRTSKASPPMEVDFKTCSSSSYRRNLKIGNLLGLRLCLYYPNQMTVGGVKVAMYRYSVHVSNWALVLFVPKSNFLHDCFYRLLSLEQSKFTALSLLVLCSVDRNRWLRFATLLVQMI